MILSASSSDTMALKFSVGVPQPPVFTSPPVAIVYLTRPMTFTISAVGTPAPKLVAGPLPDWLTFETQQQANGVIGKLSGKPPYFPGPFSLSFKASSASGEKEQTVTVFFRLVEGDLNNDGVARLPRLSISKRCAEVLDGLTPAIRGRRTSTQTAWSTSKICPASGGCCPATRCVINLKGDNDMKVLSLLIGATLLTSVASLAQTYVEPPRSYN